MDWTQVLTIVGSNIVLFLWARAESRADFRALNAEMKDFHEKMKDFHGRLCVLEERFLNWLTKEK